MKRNFALLFILSIFIFSANAIEINVLNEGVVSDSNLVQTAKIQQLIDKCDKAGGGKIIFPAGAYKTGSLVLKSNITFRVETGATIIASRDTNDYKA
ncbi:MAG TPA: glycoside hydrolase family 28 protein, partial [Paludibacteraceae bacterium]|nr:glycoside hydrolase family 28 protein [Paludibacteraceae bacterium]